MNVFFLCTSLNFLFFLFSFLFHFGTPNEHLSLPIICLGKGETEPKNKKVKYAIFLKFWHMLRYILCTLSCGAYANDPGLGLAPCLKPIPFSFLITSCPKPPEIPWNYLVHEHSNTQYKRHHHHCTVVPVQNFLLRTEWDRLH